MYEIISKCKEIIKDKKLTKTDVEFIASLVDPCHGNVEAVYADAGIRNLSYSLMINVICPEVLQALEGYKELTENNLHSLAIAGVRAYKELYRG